MKKKFDEEFIKLFLKCDLTELQLNEIIKYLAEKYALEQNIRIIFKEFDDIFYKYKSTTAKMGLRQYENIRKNYMGKLE